MAKLEPGDFRPLVAPYRVDDGRSFRLGDHDPGDTGSFVAADKDEARELKRACTEWLSEAQKRLWAQDRWGLLVIFQAMDAAGKDSAIGHVMSGMNPRGCQVWSFKAPSAEELDHDYLWRHAKRAPERGSIGIFNRSYYEEVLVVRVHPELLAAQRLPPALVGADVWSERFQDIRAYERYLARNGTMVLKFFLHLSKEEQRKRFLERLEEPEKNWKFAPADVAERGHWDEYQRAYEDMIRHTATPNAPWLVVPADHKWYTHLIVAAAIADALHGLDLRYPKLDPERREALAEAGEALRAEGG